MRLATDVIYPPPSVQQLVSFAICLLVSFQSFNSTMRSFLLPACLLLQLLGSVATNYNAFFALMITNPIVRRDKRIFKREELRSCNKSNKLKQTSQKPTRNSSDSFTTSHIFTSNWTLLSWTKPVCQCKSHKISWESNLKFSESSSSWRIFQKQSVMSLRLFLLFLQELLFAWTRLFTERWMQCRALSLAPSTASRKLSVFL